MKLVLSQDGTYPGCILSEDDAILTVMWFKWGFDGETFTSIEAREALAPLSHRDCIKRFGGLPPAHRLPPEPRDWLPALILSNPLHPEPLQLPKPFTVTRAHLAKSPDGILISGWDVPEHERRYPKAQLVGWRPERDIPFDLPVKFYRKGRCARETVDSAWGMGIVIR